MPDVLTAEERHNKQLEQELISQGRCPYCGWRTVVSGRGRVCGSCVRGAFAARLARAEASARAAGSATDALRQIAEHIEEEHEHLGPTPQRDLRIGAERSLAWVRDIARAALAVLGHATPAAEETTHG